MKTTLTLMFIAVTLLILAGGFDDADARRGIYRDTLLTKIVEHFTTTQTK